MDITSEDIERCEEHGINYVAGDECHLCLYLKSVRDKVVQRAPGAYDGARPSQVTPTQLPPTLTPRAQIAAMCMPAFIADLPNDPITSTMMSAIAETSVEMADALLTALENKQ